MKLGPVTKPDKRIKTPSKKFDNNVMSENCDVIVVFLIYSKFGAIWKLDSGHIVCKTYIFINSKLLSYKNQINTNSLHVLAICISGILHVYATVKILLGDTVSMNFFQSMYSIDKYLWQYQNKFMDIKVTKFVCNSKLPL